MGSGRGGGARGVSPVSRSHRAQGGLCVRPANAWGSGARLRVGLRGVAGMGGGVALRLGQLRGNRTKSQRRANRASWEYNRCETMALPPPKRVELGHCTRFWGRNNYPQWSGTRPYHGMGEGSTSLSCGVVCHQAWNDVWVVSPVAERRAPLAWPESPASGSPQSAPAEACRHGPAGVESAVARSPYRSALGRHSLSEFLLACVYFPSENGRHSSPHELRSRTIP